MKTILVVDDEPKIAQLVRDYLERAGFSVLIAHDGMKALSLAKTEKPDAVILDLGLPHLDGLDFTREFRKASRCVSFQNLYLSRFRFGGKPHGGAPPTPLG